jgi:hypothetical protein
MNLILLSNMSKKKGSVGVCIPNAVLWVIPGLILLAGVLMWGGYEVGVRHTQQQQVDATVLELREMLLDERALVQDARAEQRAHLDALALRVALVQARMMRIDALGERLVGVGKLDDGEFDFSIEPALGGIEHDATAEPQTVEDITADLRRVSSLLDDREAKLTMLEGQLLNRKLIQATLPSGKPVSKGWVSSVYGRRTDPFTGKRSYHHGIDFAGKRGTAIHAVAAGVVERSEKASGYGNVVEIRHVDGYTTLYGHNKKNLVEEGDVVSKGQKIALLGNTGRSSGPHVHFEVHKDGKVVNPRRYISGSK